MAAVTTFEHAGAGPKTPWITNKTTGRTFEAFRPPDLFQVTGAGRFIGEKLLELQQGLGEIYHAQDHTPTSQPVSSG